MGQSECCIYFIQYQMESRLQQQNDYLHSISFTNKQQRQHEKPSSKTSNRYGLNPRPKDTKMAKVIAYSTQGDLKAPNKSSKNELRESNISNLYSKPIKIVPYRSFKNQQRGFVQMIKNYHSKQLISSQIKWMKTSKILSNYPQELKQRKVVQNMGNLLTQLFNSKEIQPQLQINFTNPNHQQIDESISGTLYKSQNVNKYEFAQPKQSAFQIESMSRYKNIKSRLTRAVKINSLSINMRQTISPIKISLQKRQRSQRAYVESSETSKASRKHNTMRTLIQ